MRTDRGREPITGVAAGVPYVALPPASGGERAPLVVAWHMMDPPRSEAAMAAALPLAGLPAWRVYLGLPMFGTRAPAGGFEEIRRLGAGDFVLELFAPVVEQAAAEAPAAIEALRAGLPVGDGPVGLIGGSAGSAVVLLLLARGMLPVSAAALVSPVVQLGPVVAAERWFGVPYRWGEESRAMAERFDFVARAPEIARGDPQPALLLVSGAQDKAAFREPPAALRDALLDLYADTERASTVVVPEMRHSLAEEPGIEPGPRTRDAERVDRIVMRWFRRYLE